jgi:amidohydrolase
MRAVVLLLCACAGLSAGAAVADTGLDEATRQRIDALEPRLIEWRRDIHAHPELGNREFRTAALVATHLRGLGLEVQTGVAHTGVVGLLRGGRPGPVVLLRADMDALPVTEATGLPFASTAKGIHDGVEVGVMHACGHDTHVAILMAVAEVLAAMRETLPGTVKFVFQPAEEGAPRGEEGGAELMVKEGVLDDPPVDAAFALHISSELETGHLGWARGGVYASVDDFRILVSGRQAHGAYPWTGADPVLAAAHIITALQSIVSREIRLTDNAAVVTVGQIRGGVRSNIIPAEVEMIGTLRALTPDDRSKLHESVRRIATAVADGLGTRAEVQIPLSSAYPVTFNDHALADAMRPVLEAVAGPGRVVARAPVTGAEDFAFFAERVPGMYIALGGRSPEISEQQAPGHHTPEFRIDESGLGLGVRAMTAMALHYLERHAPAAGDTDH